MHLITVSKTDFEKASELPFNAMENSVDVPAEGASEDKENVQPQPPLTRKRKFIESDYSSPIDLRKRIRFSFTPSSTELCTPSPSVDADISSASPSLPFSAQSRHAHRTSIKPPPPPTPRKQSKASKPPQANPATQSTRNSLFFAQNHKAQKSSTASRFRIIYRGWRVRLEL